MSCVYETRARDSVCMNRRLLDFTTRKVRGDVLEMFKKRKILLGNEQIFSITKTTLSSVFIFQV